MFTPSSPFSRKSIASRQSGFSLVEVVLAVGVISFAFVAIMGLIPAGLTQFRQAMDTSVGAQIAQRVVQDAEQTDFNTLVDYTNTQNLQNANNTPTYFRAPSMAATTSAGLNSPGACIRYFDEEGNEIIPAARVGNPNADPTSVELSSVVYYVNTRIAASTNLPRNAASTAPQSYDLATVLVQVAFNPGHKGIPVVTGTYVFDPTQVPGMPIRNYCAQVGRNF